MARDLAQKTGYLKGQADALINSTAYHRIKGNFPLALDENLQAIKQFENLRDTASTAAGYIQMAQLYKDMSGLNDTEEYIDKAIGYSQQAFTWYSWKRDTTGIIISLNMKGINFRDKAKLYGKHTYYDTAFAVYTKALALVSQSGKGRESLGRLYNNISQVYSEYKKDYRQALNYLFKAVEYNKSLHNLSSLSFNYGNIAYAYTKLNNHQQSLFYAGKMLETSNLLNRPERIQNAYQQLYHSFKGAGQPDSALRYYVLADRLSDSLTNLKKTQQVIDLQTKYETGRKEIEILRLQTEGAEKNQHITLLLTGLVILGALAGSLVWLYQRVRKQRQQITAQSARLEVMMKELHHRVKNNLQIVSSLLSLQTHKLKNESAISVLKESQLRVQAMSFIHQRLYKTDNLTTVNMKEYLTDLAESLVASYGYHRDQFDLHIEVEKELMDIDKALPTGLIINEIITNSMKYAYEKVSRPALQIRLREENGQIILKVKDNGSGIDIEEWNKPSSSFGKQLITALCRQLRAKQELVVDAGSAFTIIIPVQAA